MDTKWKIVPVDPTEPEARTIRNVPPPKPEPVPGDGVGDSIKELIRWKQECKDWQRRAEAAEATRDEAREQRDAMRPVVEAAVAYINAPEHANYFPHFHRIESALRDAYAAGLERAAEMVSDCGPKYWDLAAAIRAEKEKT